MCLRHDSRGPIRGAPRAAGRYAATSTPLANRWPPVVDTLGPLYGAEIA